MRIWPNENKIRSLSDDGDFTIARHGRLQKPTGHNSVWQLVAFHSGFVLLPLYLAELQSKPETLEYPLRHKALIGLCDDAPPHGVMESLIFLTKL
jgi:hypothetical protein